MSRLNAQASLVIMSILCVVMIFVSIAVSETSYNQYVSQKSAVDDAQSFTLSDSGIELALLSLYRSSNYAGGTITMPEGSVAITVGSISGGKQVIATTTYKSVRRSISASASVNSAANVLEDYAAFTGDDVTIQRGAKIVGDIRSNDNFTLDSSALVQGNIFTSGAGSSSNTKITGSARVQDNPNTAAVEGNVTAIDDILINSSGRVDGLVKSSKKVTLNTGGSAGSIQQNASVSIPAINIPTFDFNFYKSQAQAAGTYYTSPSQFINFLTLSGNTITGGVHFIDSTANLNLNSSTPYNITGTIITRGSFNFTGTSYTHNQENNLPVIVSRADIRFYNFPTCACEVTVNGVLFAEKVIQMEQNSYNGAKPYAINIAGGLWAGDDVILEDDVSMVIDSAINSAVGGFNFGTTVNNTIDVTNWSID